MTLQTRCIRSLETIEDELTRSPLNHWEALLETDPTATLFQSPVWCMQWYKSYDDFEPCLLVITRGDELAGIVPLAIEISSGRLTFGGDNMADYKDIVTLPNCRRDVLVELLRFYGSGGFPNVLHFGSTLPESESPKILLSLANSYGVQLFERHHDGWRWHPAEQTEDYLKKKSIRYPINYFRRQGTLEAQHIKTEDDWRRFKESFYRQHSLRQLFGGRPVSFDNPRKRDFFDRLFRTSYCHVTALWHNNELIAGHIGCVYKEVLYWGAPSFDIRYRQYSPNLLLLVLTMQHASDWGLSAIDLTIGKGDLKERYSTRRVDLPWIELHSRRARFYARVAYAAAVGLSRGLVDRVGGKDCWEKKVKPVAETISFKALRMREMGAMRSLSHILRLGAGKIGERTRGIVFVLRPPEVRGVTPQLQPGEVCEFHDDELDDLLKRDVWNDEVAREIAVKVRGFTDAIRTGRTFHTVLVNDRLAGWGYSYWPKEPARLTEVGGASLEFESNSVSLFDFYTLPEFRGRKLYQALLTYILQKRFSEGAEQAYITVLANNTASKTAIERVGFRAITINEFTRFFRWTKLQSRRL